MRSTKKKRARTKNLIKGVVNTEADFRRREELRGWAIRALGPVSRRRRRGR